MKGKIGVLLAVGVMGLAVSGAVLAAPENGGQAAGQNQALDVDPELAEKAKAKFKALLEQGVPVEKALAQVLEEYPKAAPVLVAVAVEVVSTPTTAAEGTTDETAVAEKAAVAEKIGEIAAVAKEILGEQAEQVVTEGLLIAGLDPAPYLEATAAGEGPSAQGGETADSGEGETADSGGDEGTPPGNDAGGLTNDAGGLPAGGATGGGGGVSPA